jgi:hypothetical protein
MSQQELLVRVAGALERLEIAYFITGSWSSSLQGEPRSTHDLDVVVALTSDQAGSLLDAFPADRFYVSEPAVRDAIRDRTMFNVLDTHAGDKVDFWLLTGEPWDRARLGRRIRESVFGANIYVSSPEDTIIAKLRWADLSGGSEKQMNDARGVYEVQAGKLDIAYIESWSEKLGIAHLWREIRAESD